MTEDKTNIYDHLVEENDLDTEMDMSEDQSASASMEENGRSAESVSGQHNQSSTGNNQTAKSTTGDGNNLTTSSAASEPRRSTVRVSDFSNMTSRTTPRRKRNRFPSDQKPVSPPKVSIAGTDNEWLLQCPEITQAVQHSIVLTNPYVSDAGRPWAEGETLPRRQQSAAHPSTANTHAQDAFSFRQLDAVGAQVMADPESRYEWPYEVGLREYQELAQRRPHAVSIARQITTAKLGSRAFHSDWIVLKHIRIQLLKDPQIEFELGWVLARMGFLVAREKIHYALQHGTFAIDKDYSDIFVQVQKQYLFGPYGRPTCDVTPRISEADGGVLKTNRNKYYRYFAEGVPVGNRSIDNNKLWEVLAIRGCPQANSSAFLHSALESVSAFLSLQDIDHDQCIIYSTEIRVPSIGNSTSYETLIRVLYCGPSPGTEVKAIRCKMGLPATEGPRPAREIPHRLFDCFGWSMAAYMSFRAACLHRQYAGSFLQPPEVTSIQALPHGVAGYTALGLLAMDEVNESAFEHLKVALTVPSKGGILLLLIWETKGYLSPTTLRDTFPDATGAIDSSPLLNLQRLSESITAARAWAIQRERRDPSNGRGRPSPPRNSSPTMSAPRSYSSVLRGENSGSRGPRHVSIAPLPRRDSNTRTETRGLLHPSSHSPPPDRAPSPEPGAHTFQQHNPMSSMTETERTVNDNIQFAVIRAELQGLRTLIHEQHERDKQTNQTVQSLMMMMAKMIDHNNMQGLSAAPTSTVNQFPHATQPSLFIDNIPVHIGAPAITELSSPPCTEIQGDSNANVPSSSTTLESQQIQQPTSSPPISEGMVDDNDTSGNGTMEEGPSPMMEADENQPVEGAGNDVQDMTEECDMDQELEQIAAQVEREAYKRIATTTDQSKTQRSEAGDAAPAPDHE